MHWVGTPIVANYRFKISAEIYSEYHQYPLNRVTFFIRQSSVVVSCRIVKRISGTHSTNWHMRRLQGKR